ncbi:RnfH family protein [Shewanella sp.]|uniref:RnfH family protein n=1 Tax=Shewanella sp. TaxID=50422 RepID=UPI003A96CDD8
MKVSVVYAKPNEQVWLPVNVDEHATLLSAIEASGVLRMFPAIRLDQLKVGVFGKICSLDTELTAGDRVEIYRSITWVAPDDDDEDDDD